MTDAIARPELPDHLSIDPSSKFFVAAVFEHDIGIRFNGKDRNDVEEYCVSEGWVKVPAGKTRSKAVGQAGKASKVVATKPAAGRRTARPA